MNPFSNLAEITLGHRITLPAPQPWRLLPDNKARYGEIHGIDRVSGRAVATNGILVLLATEALKFHIGHLEWFEPWDSLYDDEAPSERTSNRKQRKSKINAELERSAKMEYI